MKKMLLLTASLAVFLITVTVASCGGGGGGGGSVAAFNKDGSGYHNGGTSGGWGSGNTTGNGFGGNGGGLGSGNDSNVVITGSTPLEVGTYNYNGASYSSVAALYAALAANTLEDVFYVDFQVEGESTPRKARVTANGRSNDGNDILIEHQYKAIFPGENGPEEVLFYKRDGIELPGGSGSEIIDGFEFEKGWQIDGQFAPSGSILAVASGGDVDLQDRAEFKIAEYGYKANTSPAGSYTLGFNSSALTSGDTVTVTTDRQITKLLLPETTSINLDLSGATNFKTVYLVDVNLGSLQEITLPSNAETIGGAAFKGCTYLTSVTLPSTLTSIQNEAFSGCDHLPSITIPAGVTRIADSTFNGCSSLSSVTFAPGSQLAAIDNDAFSGCTSLTEFEIPNGVSEIPKNAFKGCSNLQTVTMQPNTITKIGESAFENCSNLASIVIPDGVNEIKDNAFKNCNSLAAITIPDSLQYMRAPLTSVASGCTITYKGSNSFQVNTLPTSSYNVILGGGVPKFSNGMSIFMSDTNLTEVVYAGGPNLIANAFTGCSNLNTVTFQSYPSVIGTTPLPDNVHNIVFRSGLQYISNVSDINILLAGVSNLSLITVTFDNDPSNPSITINEDAFDFDGAENITYKFAVNPNTNMTYDAPTCFKDGQSATAGGTTYHWDSSTKSWQ